MNQKRLWTAALILAALTAVPHRAMCQQKSNIQDGLVVLHLPAPELPTSGTEINLDKPPVQLPQSPPSQPAAGAQPGVPTGGMPAPMQTEGSLNPAAGVAPGMVEPPDVYWINSPPLTMAKLRGKVVLIDFWEYTCINCIRTFAENKKWYERYHRYGFEIIGVHDPEFDIAAPVEHVAAAVKRFKLPYPIVVDDKYRIWNSYHNDTWPNRFLIDAKGVIRYGRAGEGADAALERAIQSLLQEAHPGLKFPASYTIPQEQDAFASACGVPTAEMYVGDWYGRGILANPEGYHEHRSFVYPLPTAVADGKAVVSGRWETEKSEMIFQGKKQGQGELLMRYHARELYAVMNVLRSHPSRLYVQQDGKDLTAQNMGVDVKLDAQGHSYILVREPRMYYVVQNPEFGSHEVTFVPAAKGIAINSFTFGNNCQVDFPHL